MAVFIYGEKPNEGFNITTKNSKLHKRFSIRYENDLTPSLAVVEAYRKVAMLDNFDESLALVHYRGGEEEFRLGHLMQLAKILLIVLLVAIF